MLSRIYVGICVVSFTVVCTFLLKDSSRLALKLYVMHWSVVDERDKSHSSRPRRNYCVTKCELDRASPEKDLLRCGCHIFASAVMQYTI